MIKDWEERGVGFKLPNRGFLEDDTCTFINLTTFADNFTLFASSYEKLQQMVDDITRRIQEVGLAWKVRRNRDGSKKGPDVMPAGSLRNINPANDITIDTEEGRLGVNLVDRLETLGVLITDNGADEESINHRLTKAEGTFWKKSRTFKGKGSPQ